MGIAVLPQDLLEQILMLVVHFNAVCGRGIVEAGSLIPQCLGGNDDAAVLDGLVQHAAVAKKNQGFHTHGQ